MRILLVKPNPPKACINLQSFMICEPLELEYCSAVSTSLGWESDIVDLVIDKDFKKALFSKNYDAVAFTGYQIHINVIKGYAKQVKKKSKNIITMVGGVQAEVVPESFYDDNIDIVLSGGLSAYKSVIDSICQKLPMEKLKELGAVSGGKTFNFPHPDRKKTAKYRDKYNYVYHDKCATIKTSFGCPYSCDFCFCTQVTKYYERDLDDVIKELLSIEEENVFIVDDNFLSRKERVLEFIRLVKENDIKKTYIAFGRADFIADNDDVISQLASVGFDAFFVGIESFKADELSDYNKRTSVEINDKAVRVLEKNGLQCYSGLIVGYDWVKKDFDNLIDYLNGYEHPMVNIQPITPIKGTPYYDRHKNELTVDESKCELFDMAHAVSKPKFMSLRKFYYNVLRAYLKTSASKKGRKYIKERYGKKAYKRVRKGAFKIAMQYVKLIIKG